jgi:hypothetical protein
MVTGFYAALAGAASVFIGILTALLAGNISNLNIQRVRIERRIEAIDARLENLDTQYNHFRNVLEEIREQENASQRREEAQEQVDEFIQEYVGTEFDIDPQELTADRLQSELTQYIGGDDLNEEQQEVLQERFEDVKNILRQSSGLPLVIDSDFSLTDSSIVASSRQIENQWEIHTEERFNRNYRRWIQTMTEIRSLQDERDRLVDRHESLDPSHIKESLRITVVTIILSVGVPVFAYFLRVSEIVIYPISQKWVEPTIVLFIWISGLVCVFSHLRSQLSENNGHIPGEPELSLNEETATAAEDDTDEEETVTE